MRSLELGEQPDLFPDLVQTERHQGFFLMFKPLERGEHTIVVHGTNTFGADKTFTYHLIVQ